jgi:hypothetical protein
MLLPGNAPSTLPNYHTHANLRRVVAKDITVQG